jgi:hypothetical protein
MGLDQHSRNRGGEFRRERGDSLAKNLRETYPEFRNVHGSTKLETLREKFGVDSLTDVREVLREKK